MDSFAKDLWSDEPEPTVVSTFNSMTLAKYFQDKFIGAQWNRGFGIVNLKALAAGMGKWKDRSDAATVTALIDKYMADPEMRGKNPGWTDFLYRAEQIAASLPITGEQAQPDKWDLAEKEWMRTHGYA